MRKAEIKLEVGKRILYHVDRAREILEGIIEQISPNGTVAKIGGKWFSLEGNLGPDSPISIEVLDELQGKPTVPPVVERDDFGKARK